MTQEQAAFIEQASLTLRSLADQASVLKLEAPAYFIAMAEKVVSEGSASHEGSTKVADTPKSNRHSSADN